MLFIRSKRRTGVFGTFSFCSEKELRNFFFCKFVVGDYAYDIERNRASVSMLNPRSFAANREKEA